ncbi:Serine/threonine kinase [Serendipita sp. 401]|nr:Serine/threonine kinase [Serendipita sp. 401]KAG9052422.1 Serine/threonine kinase [Serendipita sp. 407]
MPDPTTLSEIEEKMADISARITKEQKMIDASKAMRMATKNPDVLRKNDAEERDARKNLEYFHATLADLRQKRESLLAQASPGNRQNAGYSGGYDYDRPLPSPPQEANPRTKQYSNLDLIKADTPHTPAKIQKMLNQLEFKLQVEQQYQKGFDLMQRAYLHEGDKKSRQDAHNKKLESDKTIQLLSTALRRYKNLHVIEVVEEEEAADPSAPAAPVGDRKGALRKPLTGTLYVTVKAAKDLEHAPFTKKSSKMANETTVVLKIEGNDRAKSLPSRTDRWNQDFELSVEKANELTVAIYDKHGSEMPLPIGFTWIRLSDLVEALRRQKTGMEAAGGGWVTADGAMNNPAGYGNQGAFDPNPYQLGGDRPLMPASGMGGGGTSGATPDGIEAWFIVEPAGSILLHVNFVKENVRKRPMEAGLARQVAFRKRKEVHEMNGHKFVPQQFYQIMLCAYCSEFLLNATGYQCEDCRYTCHKKCYDKVVTKCISKSNADTEGDEDKIKHRIPHRFDTFTNLGANWCCHCGYMLPLGRKNAKKCTECNITCHSTCTHFVPDFCGMSMETANRILRDMKLIKSSQTKKPTIKQVPKASGSYGDYYQPEQQQPPAQGSPPDFGGGYYPGPSSPIPQAQTPQSMYGPDPRFQQSPQQSQSPYPGGPPAAQRPPPPPMLPARIPPPPQHPQDAGYPQTPPRPYEQQQQAAYSPRPPPPMPSDGYPAGQPPPNQYDSAQAVARPPQGVPPQGGYQARQGSLPSGPASTRRPTQPQAGAPRKVRKVGLDDFNFLAVLGKGNFGKVMLAEEKKTANLYAIKVLKKEFIIDNDEVESTRSEKRVFLAAARERHPFLLNLHSCFQTETRIYFVMEYVSGGDLMLHIQRKQFSLRQAKFYASEVLLALEYFHSQGIIYRDLKLDNILLTLDGHVKIADYGLCKEEMFYGKTTSTFCGTPEFMAPEILLEQRYGRAVDWWAFGVLTYEMLLGQSPFRGEDEDEIFDAILEDEPLYPITMPKEAVSILQKLLTRDPTRRLGSGPEDAVEIKRHPWFRDVNWDDVFNKRIPPPYFPQIKAPGDVSNFDTEFTREQPTLTPVHGQLTAKDQMEFNGFSWVANWANDV